MSILLSTILSAGLMTTPELPPKIDGDNRAELKAKIIKLLKQRQENNKLKPELPKPETVEDITIEVEPDYVLKPAAFSMYLEKYKVEDKIVEVTINSHHDMNDFTNKMLTELPHTVKITSDYYKPKELKKMYDNSMSLKVEELTPTMHGLANYSVKTKLQELVITDTSNDDYNAATIQKAVDMYVKDIVPLLEGATEVETINNIYDFMFNNFKYNADDYRDMLVGNLAAGELACNGFSYLADQLFEEAGFESYIRAGYSHYWNVLTLEDGSEVTFDVTTDIVLNEYKATLGASTKQHVEKASTIGFYSAEYYNGKYHDVAEYSGLRETIK